MTIAVPVGPKYEEKVKPIASINAMSNGLYSQLISNIARINLTKIKAKKYIVVVKNRKDDTVLIKIIGDSKEKIEKEAMKTCKDKSESTAKDSCYVHYSAVKSQY